MTNKELEAYNKNRKIWQICAITDNLEATLQQWVDRLKIGPWKVRSFNNENMDWMYLEHGKRGGKKVEEPWEMRIAITMVGDFEIEVIQPVKGPTIYQDWLDRHGPGLHHIKEKIADEKLEDVMYEFEDNGVPIMSTGKFFTDIHAYMNAEPYVDLFTSLETARLLKCRRE
ncbi:MAG: VOC family protein [Frisingicoccus sp.]